MPATYNVTNTCKQFFEDVQSKSAFGSYNFNSSGDIKVRCSLSCENYRFYFFLMFFNGRFLSASNMAIHTLVFVPGSMQTLRLSAQSTISHRAKLSGKISP